MKKKKHTETQILQKLRLAERLAAEGSLFGQHSPTS